MRSRWLLEKKRGTFVGTKQRGRFLVLAQTCLNRVVHPTEVCHKCAVPFDPMCANLLLFNTSVKRFRAGLAIGKLLILRGESTWETPSDSPTLNQ